MAGRWRSFFMSAVSTALIFFSGFTTACAAPPNRAAAPANIKVAGVDYVDAHAFLGRFGLKADVAEGGKSARYKSTWTTLDINPDSRDLLFNGVRVFMGEPAVFRGDTVYVSRIDAENLFRPLLNPSSVSVPVPRPRIIVIDAGHGGQDTGTRNKSLKLDEKGFTLDVANRLRALLIKQGYSVVMTRKNDRFIGLQERAEIANKAGADLFISIHFNAVAGATHVRGSETYVMTPRYQRSTGSASRSPDDDVANPGNRHDPWNALLGYHMHARMLEKLGSADRGFKRARFAVLRLVNCPGVLVEAGYLSNDDEARKIATPAYRAALAEALARGVQAYADALPPVKTR